MEEIPLKKDQEVQTLYRDSEAQTDPYSPDPVISGSKKPEVISETLMKLKFEFNLGTERDCRRRLQNWIILR